MASASRSLALVALGLLGFAAVYLSGGLNWLPWDLRPGSPIGQSLGIAAALILLSTLYYLPLRRSDGGRWGKPAAQALHGLAGTAGAALAILHSQAALREWSTLVLLAVVGLLATGIYGRVVAPIRVGTTFGRSAIPYAAAARPHAAATTSDALVAEKRRLLGTIAADAREGAKEGAKEGGIRPALASLDSQSEQGLALPPTGDFGEARPCAKPSQRKLGSFGARTTMAQGASGIGRIVHHRSSRPCGHDRFLRGLRSARA